MKLSLQERYLLPSLLPEKGNLSDTIITKDIATKIAITQEEGAQIKVRTEGDKSFFEFPVVDPAEFTFTGAEINLLKTAVDKLDKDGNVTLQSADLCLKIKNYEKKEGE